MDYKKVKLTSEELFLESQKPHLRTILSEIEWDRLNNTGKGLITYNEGLTKEDKYLRYYYTGDFDVLDPGCIKKGCHIESIKHLPSYMISGHYGDFLIGMVQGRKFEKNTGYPGLDFIYPKHIEIHIMVRVGQVGMEEQPIFFNVDKPVEPIEQSQKRLYEQINTIIKENQLPLEARIFNDRDRKLAQVRIYSTDRTKPHHLFEMNFVPINSLEIVMVDNFQVDSRKLL
jgi:hypothetical protein